MARRHWRARIKLYTITWIIGGFLDGVLMQEHIDNLISHISYLTG